MSGSETQAAVLRSKERKTRSPSRPSLLVAASTAIWQSNPNGNKSLAASTASSWPHRNPARAAYVGPIAKQSKTPFGASGHAPSNRATKAVGHLATTPASREIHPPQACRRQDKPTPRNVPSPVISFSQVRHRRPVRLTLGRRWSNCHNCHDYRVTPFRYLMRIASHPWYSRKQRNLVSFPQVRAKKGRPEWHGPVRKATPARRPRRGRALERTLG
jgi:hypothetical protein